MKTRLRIGGLFVLAALPPILPASADPSQSLDESRPASSTNSIAFSERRGDQSANLVLSTLDLSMMDPVDRENLLTSLEAEYGKPRAWASRAARSTSESVFGFARDGQKEKYGVRLRARRVVPVFSPDLSQVAPAEKAPAASGELVPADLLGVNRSEVLTWKLNQDDYLLGISGGVTVQPTGEVTWLNPGVNIKLPFGSGTFSPTWNGFQIKGKVQADVAGRFEYEQYFFDAFNAQGQLKGITRDVLAYASLGGRLKVEGIVIWGHDFTLPWGGTYGLGAEAVLAIGVWPSFDLRENAANTNKDADEFSLGLSVGPYVEAQGNVWVGLTEHADSDEDTTNPEGHKLVGGIKGQIVFQGTLTLGVKYECSDYDWVNDWTSNRMKHMFYFGNSKANGKLVTRGEIKFWDYTIQNGWTIWEGTKSNRGMARQLSTKRDSVFDLLL